VLNLNDGVPHLLERIYSAVPVSWLVERIPQRTLGNLSSQHTSQDPSGGGERSIATAQARSTTRTAGFIGFRIQIQIQKGPDPPKLFDGDSHCVKLLFDGVRKRYL
jgi:hypothetical protein